MKRKKFLACWLVAAMMLGTASPVMADAEVQEIFSDDSVQDEETITFEDEQAVVQDFQEDEEISYSEKVNDIEVLDSELEENNGNVVAADQNATADIFSSGESFVDDSDTNDEWKSLANQGKEERILYKYNDDEKTLYFKCIGSENVTMPDYKYAQRTDWFMDLGADKIAELKKIVIGDGITGIGQFSFQTNTSGSSYSSLEEVELADTVKSIGKGAFGKNSSLRKINLNQVSSVGMAAFARCALEQVTFDLTSVDIATNAFSGCSSLTSVKAKEISGLGEGAFEGCAALNSFEYEGTIKNIPKSAFKGTNLTTFRFGGVESIGFMAFFSSALKSGCYEGTREEWNNLVGDNEDFAEVTVHCKGDAVEAKAATCTEAGWKEVGVCEVCGEHYSYPTDENAIPAVGHTWGDWEQTTAATVFTPAVQTRKCSVCNETETRNTGKKLAPKASINASTITLKVKQSTSGLKVTGLAKGDSVKSWKSSNTKIFTVSGKSNGTCKITGKKSGTANLQITLASGLKKTVKVKVQAGTVKTSKITVSAKNVTVKKGKSVTLKPVVTPFTSGQKVTYTSSDKKIATVSSKGVVTGKKKGTVKITVKSGNKSVKVTVKVK